MTTTTTPDIAAGDQAQRVDPQAVADLMGALERVFRIGVYYPSGHAMCDRAASHFLRALERTLGKAASLRFSLAGGRLLVQDVPLDDDLRGVAGFRDILALLGISAVEIDSHVTADELHAFVTRLLEYRNRIKGAHRFQQVKVEGLPASIAVDHLEFRARDLDPDLDGDGGDGRHTGDRSNPTVEALLTALARRGLGAEDLARCRRLLEAIPDYLKENRLETASLPQVGWQDVERLLVRAVESAAEPGPAGARGGAAARSAGNVNLDALTAIFRSLGERADAENPRHAVDLLLSLTRRAPAPGDDGGQAPAKPRPARSGEAREVPIDELRAALEACAAKADGPPVLTGGSRREELVILLQMLGSDQKLPVQVRIQKRIRDIARTGLDPDERAIAVAGMRDLADPGQPERLFGPLIILTDALRASGETSVLAFLRDVAADADPARAAMIWPFLVNEILLEGRQRDREAFADACTLAAAVDDEAMQAALPRLESLAALRERRCVRAAFTPPPRELDRVFALVLGSRHADFVGERLLDGMRHHPPNWLAEAVVPLLKRYQAKYRRFLIEVLRLRDDDEPAKALLESAARIVADHLPALTWRDADAAWLPRTLRALAALPVPGGEAMLGLIVDQRRWFIIHAWSEDCRQAARDTLASWRERDAHALAARTEAEADAAPDAAPPGAAAPEETP